MKSFFTILVALTVTADPFETLQWDPSPTVRVTYRLYTHTNSPAIAGTFKDVGTNLTQVVAVTGIQFHQVTAVTLGVESEPSNEISLTNVVVVRPTNLRRTSTFGNQPGF